MTGSNPRSPTPLTLADGFSPSEKLTLPRDTPSNFEISGAKSANGPPSWPDMIRSTAWACASEMLESRTMPIVHPPALRFEGK